MTRRNGCNGKVRHATKGAACAALRKLGNAGLNSYPCQKCGGWHIGNSNKPWKIVARIDQLLSK